MLRRSFSSNCPAAAPLGLVIIVLLKKEENVLLTAEWRVGSKKVV